MSLTSVDHIQTVLWYNASSPCALHQNHHQWSCPYHHLHPHHHLMSRNSASIVLLAFFLHSQHSSSQGTPFRKLRVLQQCCGKSYNNTELFTLLKSLIQASKVGNPAYSWTSSNDGQIATGVSGTASSNNLDIIGWNNLPVHICIAVNTDTFEWRLKTFLFCKFYQLFLPADFM